MLYNLVMVVNPMADRTQKTLTKPPVQLLVHLHVCECGSALRSERVLILSAKQAV